MSLLLDLFLCFAKIGLFTFGGGYAMIVLIGNACVEKKHWLTHDEMMNITVIAESTPGPISINCATLAATFGIVLPSFCIIFLVSMFLDRFLEITWFAHAFQGIKAAVGILIIDAGFKMLKKMKKKPLSVAIVVCAFIVMLLISLLSLKISSLILMLVAGLVSLTIFMIKKPSLTGGTGS